MKILIIGFGRFGKVWADLLGRDFEVFVSDKREILEEEIKNRNYIKKIVPIEYGIKECETIFYSVPISEFENVLSSNVRILKEAKVKKVLIDLLSVKLFPKMVFEKYMLPNIECLLTHPMFGPDSIKANNGASGLPIVVDKFNTTDETYEFWISFFKSKGLKVIEKSADEHDKLAAYSQGVTHFVGRILEDFGLGPTEIDTLGAKKLQEVKEQTCNDTWELFRDLQTKNPYTKEMRVKLGKSLDRIYAKLLPNRINQEKLVVGIQGGRGSFNEEAALYYLNRNEIRDYEIKYLFTTENVLKALHEGDIDRGQFAIHNSVGGVVKESIEAMANYKFRIIERFAIKISHALMIRDDADFSEVDTIMTHDQVLAQCKKNLAEKYSRLKQTTGEGDLVDHALVAKYLSEGKLPKNIATMGSRVLAEIYNLKIVEENLQDQEENFTSFLWVERPS